MAAVLRAGMANATIPNLDWGLETGAKISGSSLVVERPVDGNRYRSLAWANVDISDCLGENSGARFNFRVRGENVQVPSAAHNGAKAMLVFPTSSGTLKYLQAKLPTGTFGWTNVAIHVSFLNAMPTNGIVRMALGLQDSGGKVVFDLAAMSVARETLGIERTNGDYVVRYPADSPPRPLRGFNSPTRATTETDMRDMRALGARLVRFQIIRNWLSADDNQDLADYAAWVDSRLDNLVDVLRWAETLDMKVAVDLHVVPGGRNADREENMYHDARWVNAYVETWRRIATRFNGHPALYGYDLINEPTQRSPGEVASYWGVQRMAAEAIRAIDRDTAIIVESAGAAGAGTFSYLSPLAMDNVIYQFHIYSPLEFTHQGALSYPSLPNVSWPAPSRGWDAGYLRNCVKRVREFQLKHKCRIFVGEFAAIAWAGGADRWLRDCIDIFEEYGWDWAYHAFRASYEWDVEREGPVATQMVPVAMTPRKSVLVDSMLYAPDSPWFGLGLTNGAATAVGGKWSASAGTSAAFSALAGREGIVRILSETAPSHGCLPEYLDGLLDDAVAGGDLAAVAFVDECDDGPLTLRCLVSSDGGPVWRRLDGFSVKPGAPCAVIAEIGCTGGVARVRYAAGVVPTPSASGDAEDRPALCRLRSADGETWFAAPADASSVAGRVAVSDRTAIVSLEGTSSSADACGEVLTAGAVTERVGSGCATVSVEVANPSPGIPDGAILRLALRDAVSPQTGVPGDVLCTIDRPYAGAGKYVFETAWAQGTSLLPASAIYPYDVVLLGADGSEIAAVAAGTLRVPDDKPWFSADAATGEEKGGAWSHRPAISNGVWQIRSGADGEFRARSGRNGLPRVAVDLSKPCGHVEGDLPELLDAAVAACSRAAIAVVEEDDGGMTLRGLALVDGAPAWVKLEGASVAAGGDACAIAEFDFDGVPRVSYLLGGVESTAGEATRLRAPSGEFWLAAVGGAPDFLAGSVSISGTVDVPLVVGTTGASAEDDATACAAEQRVRKATLFLIR